MSQHESVAALLNKYFYKLSAKYSIGLLITSILCLLIAIIRKYAIPTFEPATKEIRYDLIERIGSVICFIALFLLSIKCQKKPLMIIIYVVMPIIAFEVNAYFRSYGEAYFIYALFYSFFREIILLNIDMKTSYSVMVGNVGYHIIRAIIMKFQYKSFPFLSFLGYMMSYILINAPLLNTFIVIQNTIHKYDQLRNDFECFIAECPIPTFQFTIQPLTATIVNYELDDMLKQMGIKSKSELIIILSKNESFISSIRSNKISDSFTFYQNKLEYTLKYRKLKDLNTFVASIQDLRIIKHTEELRAKKQYKQMFFSAINHHLKTPLNGIYYPLQLLKEQSHLGENQDYLNIALNSLDILTALIDDTISFSECEEGKIKLQPLKVNINTELQKLKKLFEIESKIKLIPLNIVIETKHRTVFIDAKKLNQILIILIGNAFKFTYQGSITLKCSDNDSKITFELIDTGVGIKSEKLETLFHEFGAYESENRERLTSLGFQLCLVKKLLNIMNGDISIESTVGVGTKFNFNIPVEWIDFSQSMIDFNNSLSDFSDTEIQKHSPATFLVKFKKTFSTFDKSNILVLIVDDNATNLFVLQKMLLTFKVKSEKAMNGLECVQKVKERGMQGYSLILMDINMPLMDGIEASKEINKLIHDGIIKSMPIVAVTAQNDVSLIKECMSVGMQKCLFKPVNILDIKDLIFDLAKC
jgi:signal transduction histidine kinase/CheY-like chemotaxis protein